MPNSSSRTTVRSKWRAENVNSVKAHEKQEISLGTILSGLAISIVFIVLGYVFSGPTWEDVTFCYKTLSEGTEANALILERDTSTRLRGGRRRRRVTKKYTLLQYDGYRGRVPFWVEGTAVPVVYPKTYGPPVQDTVTDSRIVRRVDHERVLVGRKSEGFFAIYKRNFYLSNTIFGAILFFLFLGMALLFLAITFVEAFLVPVKAIVRKQQLSIKW